MKIYFDTGIFIDYLASYSNNAAPLRDEGRSNRDGSQLTSDAQECFEKLQRHSHDSATSALTIYEAERTLHENMRRSSLAHSLPNRNAFLISSARNNSFQCKLAIDLHNFTILPLDNEVIDAVHTVYAIDLKNMLTGDAIHVATALVWGAEIIVSGDADIKALDSKVRLPNGLPVRCVDTDIAKAIIN